MLIPPLRNIVLAMGLAPTVLGGCASASKEAPTSHVGTWAGATSVPAFISRLRAVADSGRLSDIATVSNLLGLSFNSVTRDQEPEPGACSETMGVKIRQTTTHDISGESWYVPTSMGVPSLRVPSFAVNPAFAIGDNDPPSLMYASHRMLYCNDPHVTARDTTETQLAFKNLPRFACITEADIRSLMPMAAFQQATDGYHFYRYIGNINNQNGTILQFSFRAFASCSLDIQIKQSTQTGLRYVKAESELSPCRRLALDKYREGHAPVRWLDARDLEAKARYAEDVAAADQHMLQACGTFEDRYREKSPSRAD